VLSFELVVVSRSRNWFDKLTAGCAPRFAKATQGRTGNRDFFSHEKAQKASSFAKATADRQRKINHE
jgi:hypothetical protein